MNTKRKWCIVAIAGGLLLAAACNQSDTVAPDGATITLAATPATILVSNGQQAEEVTILATVRDSIGVPLPGQDVRFTNSQGSLNPPGGTPVPTDDIGNALTFLNGATVSTTITAQSGKATANVTLQTTTCSIAGIELSDSSLSFSTCADHFDLTATVKDAQNKPCAGIVISFKSTVASPPATDIQLVIQPGSKTTDASGAATTTVSLDQSKCSELCTGKNCNSSGQQIEASGGGVIGTPVTVIINI